MKKIQRNLRLKSETVRVLTAAVLPRVAAGGSYEESNTTSSFSERRTFCPDMSDCVGPLPK